MMTDDMPQYQINESDAVLATAREVARVQSARVILDLRQSFLCAVDTLERAVGISPTTAEIRSLWRRQQNGNGRISSISHAD